MLDPHSLNKEVWHETSIKREFFSFKWSINEFGKFLNRKYEFSSPIFSPKSLDTSKWMLTVFPENAYPQGSGVALKIQNASSDSRCYSVMYTVMLIDINGTHHELQTREKVFRYYLDYDECPVTSNKVIREKQLLQNDSLTICCKLDILVGDNPSITSTDSMSLQENTNVATEKGFSCMNRDEKLYEYECRMNNLSSEKNHLKKNNTLNLAKEDILNTKQHVNMNFQQMPNIKTENSKNNYKFCDSYVFHKDESKKSFNNLPGTIDSSVHKAKGGKGKLATDSLPKSFEILSNDLSFLYTTKYQYDITIHTDDGQIRAHKAILAARSDYFKRTLISEENKIYTEGINTTTMNAVLFYMYSGQNPQMTFDLAMDVLTACNTFHLTHLGEMAQKFLMSQANVNNVTDILSKAKELKLDDLKISALQFVAKNRESITKTSKWNQMIDNDPHSAGEILLTIAAFLK